MKQIKIASGIKRIEDTDRNAVLFRLRDVLSDHRNALISRLLNDLSTYVDYKFQTRIDQRQEGAVKDALQDLKNSVLDLDRYNGIVEHFLEHPMTYVGTEPFMKEIDEVIGSALNLPQLRLV